MYQVYAGRSFLFDCEKWLDDRVHLVHVGAGPHDPHTDGSDDDRDHPYSE